MIVTLSAHALSAGYGRRLVFRNLSFTVAAGQMLGVVGPSGAGKTTLLRTIAGLLTPREGDVRISGLAPRDAVARTRVAYFAGEGTLPGAVRAATWARLAHGALVVPERRRIRTLSRGTRQLLGLRTALGRHALDVVILDEPWDSLDEDGARWLSATLVAKRDRGAAVVVASHEFHHLAGACDAFLFLLPPKAVVMKAQEVAPAGAVTAEHLGRVLDALRDAAPAMGRMRRIS